MSEGKVSEIREKMGALLDLKKAPSQFKVFFHLLGTGRTMSVREISGEVGLTPKATERAVAKLLDKGLVQRSPFRDRSYTCDSKEVLLGLMLETMELREKLSDLGR